MSHRPAPLSESSSEGDRFAESINRRHEQMPRTLSPWAQAFFAQLPAATTPSVLQRRSEPSLTAAAAGPLMSARLQRAVARSQAATASPRSARFSDSVAGRFSNVDTIANRYEIQRLPAPEGKAGAELPLASPLGAAPEAMTEAAPDSGLSFNEMLALTGEKRGAEPEATTSATSISAAQNDATLTDAAPTGPSRPNATFAEMLALIGKKPEAEPPPPAPASAEPTGPPTPNASFAEMLALTGKRHGGSPSPAYTPPAPVQTTSPAAVQRAPSPARRKSHIEEVTTATPSASMPVSGEAATPSETSSGLQRKTDSGAEEAASEEPWSPLPPAFPEPVSFETERAPVAELRPAGRTPLRRSRIEEVTPTAEAAEAAPIQRQAEDGLEAELAALEAAEAETGEPASRPEPTSRVAPSQVETSTAEPTSTVRRTATPSAGPTDEPSGERPAVTRPLESEAQPVPGEIATPPEAALSRVFPVTTAPTSRVQRQSVSASAPTEIPAAASPHVSPAEPAKPMAEPPLAASLQRHSTAQPSAVEAAPSDISPAELPAVPHPAASLQRQPTAQPPAVEANAPGMISPAGLPVEPQPAASLQRQAAPALPSAAETPAVPHPASGLQRPAAPALPSAAETLAVSPVETPATPRPVTPPRPSAAETLASSPVDTPATPRPAASLQRQSAPADIPAETTGEYPPAASAPTPPANLSALPVVERPNVIRPQVSSPAPTTPPAATGSATIQRAAASAAPASQPAETSGLPAEAPASVPPAAHGAALPDLAPAAGSIAPPSSLVQRQAPTIPAQPARAGERPLTPRPALIQRTSETPAHPSEAALPSGLDAALPPTEHAAAIQREPFTAEPSSPEPAPAPAPRLSAHRGGLPAGEHPAAIQREPAAASAGVTAATTGPALPQAPAVSAEIPPTPSAERPTVVQRASVPSVPAEPTLGQAASWPALQSELPVTDQPPVVQRAGAPAVPPQAPTLPAPTLPEPELTLPAQPMPLAQRSVSPQPEPAAKAPGQPESPAPLRPGEPVLREAPLTPASTSVSGLVTSGISRAEAPHPSLPTHVEPPTAAQPEAAPGAEPMPLVAPAPTGGWPAAVQRAPAEATARDETISTPGPGPGPGPSLEARSQPWAWAPVLPQARTAGGFNTVQRQTAGRPSSASPSPLPLVKPPSVVVINQGSAAAPEQESQAWPGAAESRQHATAESSGEAPLTVIQRTVTPEGGDVGSGTTGTSPTPVAPVANEEEPKEAAPNLDQMARQVLPYLKRLLAVERERRPGRW
jgi:hypothetical protein